MPNMCQAGADAAPAAASRALESAIGKARRILVSSHVRPDGDAIGSQLAMLHDLRARGKEVRVVDDAPPQAIYRFLEGFPDIRRAPDGLDGPFDLAIALDCQGLDRLGSVAEAFRACPEVANLDHHASNDRFGTIRIVEPDAAATAEVLFRHFSSAGRPVTEAMAKALWAGLASDTGRFLHSNTSASCLETAAALVRAGVSPGEMGNRLYRDFTFPQMRLQSLAASSIRLHLGGRVAILRATEAMERESGARYEELADLVEFPRSIRGVEVAAVLSPLRDGSGTRASLRSNRIFDVDALARPFKGGGHRHAAGCTIESPMDEAEGILVRAIEAAGLPPAGGAP